MKTNQMFSSAWSEITSGGRNEIVFERLNKTYGAYEIRTHYDQTLLKAFSVTALMIVLFSAYIFISGYFNSVEKKIPIPFDPTTLKPFVDNEKPIIPEEPKIKVTSSPKTKEDTEPEIKDESEKDEKEILPKNPNTTFSGGNTIDTTSGDTPFIPIPGSKKYIEDDSTYDNPLFLQEPPAFPGGDEALFAFLRKNIYYPQDVKEVGGKGIVGISFVLDKEGNVTEASVRNATNYFQLDKEALRVVKKLPKWNPGKQQGRAVKVRMILPIRFELKQ